MGQTQSRLLREKTIKQKLTIRSLCGIATECQNFIHVIHSYFLLIHADGGYHRYMLYYPWRAFERVRRPPDVPAAMPSGAFAAAGAPFVRGFRPPLDRVGAVSDAAGVTPLVSEGWADIVGGMAGGWGFCG